MAVRQALGKRLFEAWSASIDNDYCKQRINSERSLQASFWAQVNQRLFEASWRLFVEPQFQEITGVDAKLKFPDLVICNSKEVVAVIELKYQPKSAPSVEKDLGTLAWISEHREQLYLTNKRYLGVETTERRFPISKKTLFVWAGVFRQQKTNEVGLSTIAFADGIDSLKECFLQMQAETNPNQVPVVSKRSC